MDSSSRLERGRPSNLGGWTRSSSACSGRRWLPNSIRLHDSRHFAATLLLAQGTHPRTVMEILGHSDISLTMNTYSHVVPQVMREAAEKIDAVLGGK